MKINKRFLRKLLKQSLKVENNKKSFKMTENDLRKVIRKNLIKEEYDVKNSGSWRSDADYWANNLNKVKADGINFHKLIKGGNNNYRSATPPDDPEYFKQLKEKLGIENLITLQPGRVSAKSNYKSGKERFSGHGAVKAAKEAGWNVLYLPSNDDGDIIRIGTPKTEEGTKANFKKIKDMLDGGNTLIHCQHGADRTGAAIGAYYVTKGMDPEEALKDAYKYKSGGKSLFFKGPTDFIIAAIKDVEDKSLMAKLKQKYSDTADSVSKGIDNLKNATFKKVYDTTITDIDSSNNFRAWVNKNKSKDEVKKILRAAGLSGGFDESISNKKYIKNKYVEVLFSKFGTEYTATGIGIKKPDAAMKNKKDENLVNMKKVVVAKSADNAFSDKVGKPGTGIPEKYIKAMIGDKGSTRLSVGIGTQTGTIYSRIAGSQKPWDKRPLNENKSFANINLSAKDFIKALSPKINIVKSIVSDKALKKIEKIEKEIKEDLKTINPKDIKLSQNEQDKGGAAGRAQELSEILGLDPAFIYAEEKKESASKPRVMAWNVHIMRNPDFYKDKSHVITKDQQKQLSNLGFPKKKSYYGNDAIKAFRKAWEVNPYGAIVAGAWGLYQVLGSFSITDYDSPGEWARAFNEDPIEFSKKSFVTWVNQPEYGKKFIDAANKKNYKYTTGKYFGSSTSEMGQEYARLIGVYAKQYRRKFGKDWTAPGKS